MIKVKGDTRALATGSRASGLRRERCGSTSTKAVHVMASKHRARRTIRGTARLQGIGNPIKHKQPFQTTANVPALAVSSVSDSLDTDVKGQMTGAWTWERRMPL